MGVYFRHPFSEFYSPTIYESIMEILNQDAQSKIEGGSYNAESTFIISIDSFNRQRALEETMTMARRTQHSDYNIQMQVNQNKDFAQILYSSDQDKTARSISLKPGYEYKIQLAPKGRMSSESFKELSFEQRNCRLDHEVLDEDRYKIYLYFLFAK